MKLGNIHPKVVAAGFGGGTGTGLVALLSAFGVHFTPSEAAGIAGFLSLFAGYMMPVVSKAEELIFRQLAKRIEAERPIASTPTPPTAPPPISGPPTEEPPK